MCRAADPVARDLTETTRLDRPVRTETHGHVVPGHIAGWPFNPFPTIVMASWSCRNCCCSLVSSWNSTSPGPRRGCFA